MKEKNWRANRYS